MVGFWAGGKDESRFWAILTETGQKRGRAFAGAKIRKPSGFDRFYSDSHENNPGVSFTSL
ncbi:hypothetical protein TH61_06855 [Rufibacter sp. DG15C]|uniref:hypothetical protein n=1 Tax=Rufibacter sp. DG15C TaxID=1379909 RepID=UPI00078E8871|nr:hypothetical protein [Rufibacter sp. DG15C]AMM50954.1 hypothetical protein TH61_06855 [Rufibacter sp. DG15C]